MITELDFQGMISLLKGYSSPSLYSFTDCKQAAQHLETGQGIWGPPSHNDAHNHTADKLIVFIKCSILDALAIVCANIGVLYDEY